MSGGFLSRFSITQRITAAYRANNLPDNTSFKGLGSNEIVSQIESICKASFMAGTDTQDSQRTMTLPFRLFVMRSGLPSAGMGVFVGPTETSPIIRKGTVVCLYPGVIYQRQDPVFFPSIANHFILQRIDGTLIDGKHTGLSKSIFTSIWKRERAWNGIDYDSNWIHLRKEAESTSWSIGQLINNSFNSMDDANVIYNEFCLTQSFPNPLRRYIPNVPFSPDEENIQGISLVTTKDICFSSAEDRVELLASYQSF